MSSLFTSSWNHIWFHSPLFFPSNNISGMFRYSYNILSSSGFALSLNYKSNSFLLQKLSSFFHIFFQVMKTFLGQLEFSRIVSKRSNCFKSEHDTLPHKTTSFLLPKERWFLSEILVIWRGIFHRFPARYTPFQYGDERSLTEASGKYLHKRTAC